MLSRWLRIRRRWPRSNKKVPLLPERFSLREEMPPRFAAGAQSFQAGDAALGAGAPGLHPLARVRWLVVELGKVERRRRSGQVGSIVLFRQLGERSLCVHGLDGFCHRSAQRGSVLGR